jgi:hypothetical protein
MELRARTTLGLVGVALAASVAATAHATPPSTLPKGDEPVNLDPADFSPNINNRKWPMRVGSRWIYRVTDMADGSTMRQVITVTRRTKLIADGIRARVVHDVVRDHGKPVEVTDDWYAQDSDGNVWYLGEATAEYKNGKPTTTAGSFEAGVDGAQAGIAMPANPEPGMAYRQEYYKGVAEDKGAVITVGQEQVEVPFGHLDADVLMTRDLVPTEPKVQELKFYAPGVGPVLSVHTDGAGGRAELVSYTPGR